MLVNANFDERIVIDTLKSGWVSSPVPGIERIMLDRLGAEDARATSIVRYAAGTTFTPHEHPLGEDFLVLSGVFSDEHGDYPAGTWLRSPHLSVHNPYSNPGSLIYVKVGHLG